MLFSARAAEGVAGDKTLTPRASYSGLQEIVTPRLIEQLELIEATPVDRHGWAVI
jgi:hypothetical protein